MVIVVADSFDGLETVPVYSFEHVPLPPASDGLAHDNVSILTRVRQESCHFRGVGQHVPFAIEQILLFAIGHDEAPANADGSIDMIDFFYSYPFSFNP